MPGASVVSSTGLVVSASDIAADIGASILSKGGNAVDAAVATAFAMAVTHPAAGNLGGGGFMIVRTPDGRATAFDYRERAPGKSTPTMYLGPDGEIDRSLTAAGYLAPGVPGTVRGMGMAHRRFGRLPWRDVVMPAAELALSGFTMSETLARSLNGELQRMQPFPASVAAYGKPGGGDWAAGDTIVLGDLARTLTAIATDGPDAFYTGWIADRIAADMAAHGGLITKADLAGYEARERVPVTGTFLGHEIISMPPPSSGGTVLIEMLNMLEALDIQNVPRATALAHHLMTEAMRRAYADRARYLGDPDFVEMPIARLTSKAYADELRRTISSGKASVSAPESFTWPAESTQTTHFSVVDKDRNAVSLTYTLEYGYGSGIVVPGGGFLLNNEMGDFNAVPGLTDNTGLIGTSANLAEPGKRMLSSMSPTIVNRNGEVFMVTGSPGGRTIINTVLQTILNVIDHGANAQTAVDLGRVHHQWLPDTLYVEQLAFSPDSLKLLESRGHTIERIDGLGVAEVIVVRDGVLEGGLDRRQADGGVVGY